MNFIERAQKIFDAASGENAAIARRKMEKRLDYYNDNQEKHLLEIIRRQFSHADPLALQPQFFNVVKPIINEISMVYRSGARRHITNLPASCESEKIAAIWQQIQNTARYDIVMKTVNRLTNLCRTVLVKPSCVNGNIILTVFTPDRIEFLPDPDFPWEAVAIMYSRANVDGELVWHYWDSKNYARFDENGALLFNARNPENINPYGKLPFARFATGYDAQNFMLAGGDDLINAQDNINVKLTQLNYLVKMQSFSVPVLKGYRGQEKIVISPGKPISIPSAGFGENVAPDFKFETPSPQIEGLIKVVESELMRLFRAYGIAGADFSLQRNVRSGFSIVMENMKLLEARENELPLYEDAEQELFETIKLVHNYHVAQERDSLRLPDSCKLQVSMNDISMPKSADDEITEWKFLLDNRLATPVDFLMRRFKLSEAEAQERFAETSIWWKNFAQN